MSGPDNPEWQHVSLWCADWHTAEQMAVTHLGPRLMAAEAAEVITSWWFIRKGASWRVRCLAAHGQDEQATAVVAQTMRELVADGAVLRWATTIYEPETHAFGGPDGVDLAHQLFHADSRHLLEHLRQAHDDHRRELGLLLATQLVHAAGQDWYEQGDVWARVAGHRRTDQPPSKSQTAMAAVHRLITAPANNPHRPLTRAPQWLAAYRRAGQRLAELADQGRLTRGLRAVLAHHILFAWNRAGISAHQQNLLAATAARVIFHQEPARSSACPGRLAEPRQLGSGR
jgi:protein-L-isoaspartate(D-aspartate) O-methyltransferase